MKNIMNTPFHRQLLLAIALCSIIGSAYAMKRALETPTTQPITTQLLQPIVIQEQQEEQEKLPRFEKYRTVWVQTVDGKLVSMLEWQIHQIAALHVLLAHQRGVKSKDNPQGTNSKTHPIDLSAITKNDDDGTTINATAETLQLLKAALEAAGNRREFLQFLEALTPEQQTDLLNGAQELEANGLTALLAEIKFQSFAGIQDLIGTIYAPETGATIIKPVVDYLAEQKNNIKDTYLPLDMNSYKKGYIFINLLQSPNNRYIAFIIKAYEPTMDQKNYNLILWDTKTNTQTKSFIDYTLQNPVTAFSPDSKYIACICTSDGIEIIDTTTKESLGLYQTLNNINRGYIIEFSSNNKYIRIGNHLFNLEKALKERSQKISEISLDPQHGYRSTHKLLFSPDGKYIASQTDNNFNDIIIWRTDTAIPTIDKTISVTNMPMTPISWSPDSKHLVIQGKINTGCATGLWNIETQKPMFTINKSDATAFDYYCNSTSVTFSPNSKSVFFLNKTDNSNCFWNLETKIATSFAMPITNTISITIQFSDDSRYFVVQHNNDNIIVYDTEKNTISSWPRLSNNNKIYFSQNNDFLIIITNRSEINIVHLKDYSSTTVAIHNLPYHRIFLPPLNAIITLEQDKYKPTVYHLPLELTPEAIHYIANNLTLSQARFLYRLYIAQLNKTKVIIHENDQDYGTYNSLPDNIKKIVDEYLPFGTEGAMIKPIFTEFRK